MHAALGILTVDERAALVVGHGLLQGLAEPDGLQQLVPGLDRLIATLLAHARAKGRRWRRWARQGCRRRWRRRRRERHGALHPSRKNRQKQAVSVGKRRRSDHWSSAVERAGGPTDRGRGATTVRSEQSDSRARETVETTTARARQNK